MFQLYRNKYPAEWNFVQPPIWGIFLTAFYSFFDGKNYIFAR